MATTLAFARRSVQVVAAVFVTSREDVIPVMFRRLLATEIVTSTEAKSLVLYLERHIDLDEGSHGPMARHLLEAVCGADQAVWAEVEVAAREAIAARLALWDGIVAAISAGR